MVRHWWQRNPEANIGLPTGALTGLLVVDVDVHPGGSGYDAFERSRAAGLAVLLISADLEELIGLSDSLFVLYDGAVQTDLPLIDARHEQTVVFAAEGWAKVTRRLGCAAITAGPGVTNFKVGDRAGIPFFFGEDQARYLIAAPSGEATRILSDAAKAGVPAFRLGQTAGINLVIGDERRVAVARLREAFGVGDRVGGDVWDHPGSGRSGDHSRLVRCVGSPARQRLLTCNPSRLERAGRQVVPALQQSSRIK